jgi:hypothetical protein
VGLRKKKCKSDVVVSDTFQSRTCLGAKRKAIHNWREKVKQQLGVEWSQWARANAKERFCWGPAKKANAYVKAIPCKKR